MPNCFTLTKNGETKPMALNAIDEELCSMLGIPVHPEKWVHDWYNLIGFNLACGQSLDKIHSVYATYAEQGDNDDKQLLAIVEYLRDNFTSDCWRE